MDFFRRGLTVIRKRSRGERAPSSPGRSDQHNAEILRCLINAFLIDAQEQHPSYEGFRPATMYRVTLSNLCTRAHMLGLWMIQDKCRSMPQPRTVRNFIIARQHVQCMKHFLRIDPITQEVTLVQGDAKRPLMVPMDFDANSLRGNASNESENEDSNDDDNWYDEVPEYESVVSSDDEEYDELSSNGNESDGDTFHDV